MTPISLLPPPPRLSYAIATMKNLSEVYFFGPDNPQHTCDFCPYEEPAVTVMRVQWPHNDEMSNFHDFRLCQWCLNALSRDIPKNT